MTPYQYTPLNEANGELRLLHLLPGRSEDDIRVTLEVVRLQPHNLPVRNYEALSYTWGSTTDLVNIRITSASQQELHTLGVTQNLVEALPYLRYHDQERMLWIDAICIDQQNLSEKSSQVLRMADIFTSADQVIVWLGPEHDESTHAMDLLGALGSRIEVDWVSSKMTPVLPKYASLVDPRMSLPFSDEDCTAIQALLYRPWFERLWIRQEIQLSRSAVMLCGSACIRWKDFRNSVFCLGDKAVLAAPRKRLRFLHDLVEGVEDYALSFDLLMVRAAGTKCWDPRDRIFAVLGLMTGFERARWSYLPNYSKTVAETYTDAGFSYMEATGSLQLLSYCDRDLRNTSRYDLPTWVPDWSCMPTRKPEFGGMSDGLAAGDFTLLKPNGYTILRAKGVYLDRVKHVQDTTNFDASSDMQFTIQHIQAFVKTILDSTGQKCVENWPLLCALCRTILLGYFRDSYEPPILDLYTEEAARQTLRRILMLEHYQNYGQTEGTVANDAEIRGFLRRAEGCTSGRSFFTTGKGCIGLTSQACRPGDSICVLLGCDVPLVIRPAVSSTRAYQVVGACYLSSAMDGEAIMGPLPAAWRLVSAFDENRRGYVDGFKESSSSQVQREDPRWNLVLGEDYLSHLDTDGKTQRERELLVVGEVMKTRGVNTRWFGFI